LVLRGARRWRWWIVWQSDGQVGTETDYKIRAGLADAGEGFVEASEALSFLGIDLADVGEQVPLKDFEAFESVCGNFGLEQ
jgi:hypothetical protein